MSDVATERIATDGYGSLVHHAGRGNERALFLAHGGGPGAEAASYWTPLLAALGDGHHVVAPDLVGFGRTDHPDEPPAGPEAWFALRVRQVLALADHFGHERIDLVGNSLGGAFALRFALAHPERLGRLVLVGSAGAPVAPLPGLGLLVRFDAEPTAENLEALTRAYVHDTGLLGDVGALVAARMPATTDPVVRRSWHAMYHDARDALAAGEVAIDAGRAARITHRTLVVHGLDDAIIDAEAGRWFQEALPDADLHLFAGCGHWAMLERAAGFEALLRGFLAGERAQVPSG